MLKITVRSVFLLITLFILFTTGNVKAANTATYLVDENVLSNDLKQRINSIYLKEENNELQLCLNGISHKPSYSDPNSAEYRLVDKDINYSIKVDLKTKKISFYYSILNKDKNTICCYLTTENGTFVIYVYPNIKSNDYYRIEGTNKGNKVIFNKLFLDYLNVNLSFELIDDNFTVKCNGTAYTSKINPMLKKQYVFLEKLVEQHTLPMDYFNFLIKQSFFDAKKLTYSMDEIRKVANNETLTLINKTNGLSRNVQLTPIIGYWKRIGEEQYDTNYDKNVQVVGQYEDDICAELHNKLDKTYHIFADEYYVNDLDIEARITMFYDYENLERSDWMDYAVYSNITSKIFNVETAELVKYAMVGQWGNYKYSYDPIYSSISRQVNKEYSYRTVSYTDFSDYLYDPDDVEFVDKILLDSKKQFAKSFLMWGEYGNTNYSESDSAFVECKLNDNCKYITIQKYGISNAIPTGKKSDYISSCKATDDYRCEKYYKYTCDGLISSTYYSAMQYDVGKIGPCKNGHKIKSVSPGYRKEYINYVEPSTYNLDSCNSVIGQSKCFLQNIYRLSYNNWTEYSDYIYDDCRDSSTVKCKSRIKYAKRDRILSQYSDYSETYPTASNVYDIKTRYKYREREILGYGLDTQQPYGSIYVGKGIYYRFSYPLLKSREELYYIPKRNCIGDLESFSEKQIIDLATEYSKKEAIVQYINAGNNVSYEDYDNFIGKDLYDTTTYNNILYANLYLPNLYVIKHYRATKSLLDVECLESNISFTTGETNAINSYSDSFIYLDEHQEKQKNRIVFFDEKSDYLGFDKLLSNWNQETANSMKEAIENANNALTAIITKKDIEDMHDYVRKNDINGLYDHFSHLFKEKE